MEKLVESILKFVKGNNILISKTDDNKFIVKSYVMDQRSNDLCYIVLYTGTISADGNIECALCTYCKDDDIIVEESYNPSLEPINDNSIRDIIITYQDRINLMTNKDMISIDMNGCGGWKRIYHENSEGEVIFEELVK